MFDSHMTSVLSVWEGLTLDSAASGLLSNSINTYTDMPIDRTKDGITLRHPSVCHRYRAIFQLLYNLYVGIVCGHALLWCYGRVVESSQRNHPTCGAIVRILKGFH